MVRRMMHIHEASLDRAKTLIGTSIVHKMLKNPYIYIGQATTITGSCYGHRFGITYSGRLVFFDHKDVRAGRDLDRFGRISPCACSMILTVFESVKARRHRSSEQAYKHLSRQARKAEGRKLMSLPRTPTGMPLFPPLQRVLVLERAGLIKQLNYRDMIRSNTGARS